MTRREELLVLADQRGYKVLEPPVDGTLDSVTIISPKGTRCIFQRQNGRRDPEINEGLSHELGHCETDSFYTALCAPACILRCEEIANRWAYRKMVPLHDLMEAIRDGETEPWQLAERLEVPEPMILRAVTYYMEALSVKIPK